MEWKTKFYHNILAMLCFYSGATKGNIDAKIGQLYHFGLFENFEICSKIYQEERKIVKTIFEIRSQLINLKDGLQCTNKTDLLTLNLQEMLRNEKINLEQWQNNIEKMTTHFPSILDFMDSIKAIFFLHYTYRFNITLAVLEGDLSIENNSNYKKRYQVFELHLGDDITLFIFKYFSHLRN